jgi:hypothetical protein
MSLEEQFYETSRARWQRQWPWLHLFRAFRLAIRVRMLLLGMSAVVLLEAGWGALDRMTDGERRGMHPPLSFTRAEQQARSLTWDSVRTEPLTALWRATSYSGDILRPWWTVAAPGMVLFGRSATWPDCWGAAAALGWGFLIWSLAGVALSRTAAVRFARDGDVGLREAVAFSGSRLGSSLGAALVPLCGAALLCGLTTALGGHWGRVPGVGPVLVGLLSWLPWLLSLGCAAILLTLAVCWPLMLCAVSVDDADAFDAFSRAYGYVWGRPWMLLGLAVTALIYGSGLLVFTSTLLTAGTGLARTAGAGWPRALEVVDSGRGASGLEQFAAAGIDFWSGLIGAGLAGFVVSYFWTACTISYSLVRQSHDATPLEVVAMPEPRRAGDLPLVGMAATARREAGQAVSPPG